MPKIILSVIFTLLSFVPSLFSQDLMVNRLSDIKIKYNFLNDKLYKDSVIKDKGKEQVQKLNIGGVFLAPDIGVAFPVGAFTQYANAGLVFGLKLEFAFSKMYPFIPGIIYEGQKNIGNEEFVNLNLLEQFETKTNSIGVSLDILLNKFVKSDFTTPIFTVEVKYANVSKYINPDITIPGVDNEVNLMTYAAGFGATLYVFDVFAKYTFAQDYSSLAFQIKFHLPLIKF